MVKRRRLSDLYVTGKPASIGADTGEPVEVWLQKLNELDRNTAIRRASAAQARYQIDVDDEQSDTFNAALAEVHDLDRDQAITMAIAEDVSRVRARVEAERAMDEETWGKNGYLQGLVDAWIGNEDSEGLAATFQEQPEDPEAVRVKGELDRFEQEVYGLVSAQVDALRRDLQETPEDRLYRLAAKALLKGRSDQAFLAEYTRQTLYLGVREPDDHGRRYFSTLAEYDDLPDKVRLELTAKYNDMTVEPAEGKGSRATPGSSASSEASDEGTPSPSGPEAADA